MQAAPGRTDHGIALDFLAEVRGVPATESESALLLEAVDACCHDPDLDALVAASPLSRAGEA